MDTEDVTEQIQQEQERDIKRAEYELIQIQKRIKSGTTTNQDCDILVGALRVLGVNIKGA